MVVEQKFLGIHHFSFLPLGVPSTQTFTLPLTHTTGDKAGEGDRKEMGLLNVTVSYKHHTIQPHAAAGMGGGLTDAQGGHVTLTVGVLRAAGLQVSR